MQFNDTENEDISIGINDLRDDVRTLLLEFLPTRKFDSDDRDIISSDSTICIAYTSNDVSVISQTIQRLREANQIHEIPEAERLLLQLKACDENVIVSTLSQEGIARVDNLLSNDLCVNLLSFINNELSAQIANDNPMTTQTGFGDVLCREHRWDMYLNATQREVHESLGYVFKSTLQSIFAELFNGENAEFHELSALISDNGANAQPIHPDSRFTDEPIMFTVFIALQDINEQMGPTIFLPRTHNRASHDQHKATNNSAFLASCEYRQSLLKAGDAVIMDSRLLHSGHFNIDSRRILLYFTIRNPLYFYQTIPAVPTGSKWASLDLHTHDFLSC